MKRPSAAASSSVSKRIALPGIGDPVSKQCRGIREAMLSAEGVSPSLLEMLTANLGASLGVAKEDRHPFQESVVAMIGEVLDRLEADLKAGIEAEQVNANATDAELKAKTEAKDAADQTATQKAEATAAAKAAMGAAASALVDAKSAAATAEAEQVEGDAEYEKQAATKAKLETMQATSFKPLQDGTAAAADIAASIDVLVALGKEYNFDASLLGSLPSALKKAPDARGSFDNMCFDHLGSELAKQISLLSDALASGEAGKAARAAKTEAAKTDLATKEQVDQSSKEAFKEAQAAQKQAEAEAKDAAKTVREYQPEVKKAAGGLKAAKDKLEDLQNGALADFFAVKDGKMIDGHVYDRQLLAAVEGFAATGGQVSYVEAKKLWENVMEDQKISNLERATLGYAMKTFTFTDKAENFVSTHLQRGRHTSYYEVIDGKKFDRALLEEARLAVADGQVSLKEAKKLFSDAKDGNAFTGTERDTLEYALKTLAWTDVARKYMTDQLQRDKPASYYKMIDGKQYDNALLLEIEDYASSNGSVSEAEAERLWVAVNDGPGVTTIEKNTLKYGLATFAFTDAAKAFLQAKI